VEGLNQFFQARAAEMWIALALLVLILEIWVFMLYRRINRLQKTVGARPRPSSPLTSQEQEAIAQLQHAFPTALQKFGMVRFNPFDDTGGDQSFALCVADDAGNGFVMSSLHRRTESKVYAKPLSGWQSQYSLSAEEQQAMGIARNGAASDAAAN
jgi:hypothetical protein